MNLEEIRNFAIDIDLKKVDPQKRHLIKCFKDMIIEQTGIVFDMEARIRKFNDNIANHLIGLEKQGIVFKVNKGKNEHVPKGAAVPKE